MTDESHEIQPAWWQPWRWPWSVWGLVVVLLALLPFAVRATFLSSVPAMAEPFDVAAFVKDDIPPDENAFTEYQQALTMRKRLMQGTQGVSSGYPNGFDDIFKQGWESADEPMRAWLEEHREALAVWRRGTEKSRALAVSPGEMTFATNLESIQMLRDFARLARLDQLRCLHEGNVDEAWQLARAVYRSGRHATSRGPQIAGMYGIALHAMGSEGMSLGRASDGDGRSTACCTRSSERRLRTVRVGVEHLEDGVSFAAELIRIARLGSIPRHGSGERFTERRRDSRSRVTRFLLGCGRT